MNPVWIAVQLLYSDIAYPSDAIIDQAYSKEFNIPKTIPWQVWDSLCPYCSALLAFKARWLQTAHGNGPCPSISSFYAQKLLRTKLAGLSPNPEQMIESSAQN